ncbi:hypothetical protein EDD38_4449 [Kitasatospora cineracea]|uniref:Uncharacterized protein n=1 Tax=Kitasatospora cineracea TaxID=88074 RepID=A0A3N4RRM3_9ACTN|nr:hypothetical protein EDD38_4449 [Kitasatospora cineracea]
MVGARVAAGVGAAMITPITPITPAVIASTFPAGQRGSGAAEQRGRATEHAAAR